MQEGGGGWGTVTKAPKDYFLEMAKYCLSKLIAYLKSTLVYSKLLHVPICVSIDLLHLINHSEKPSKRLASAKRYKIEKKVREHNRKLKKLAKKSGRLYERAIESANYVNLKRIIAGQKRKGHEKIINVPNKCPFKEELLFEAEKAREDAELRKCQQKKTIKMEVGMKRKLSDNQSLINSANSLPSGATQTGSASEDKSEKAFVLNDKTIRAYAKEVRKTIESADIVVEVLDARDPLGGRCADMEQLVMSSGKRLVLLLNKIDLVPKENVKNWLTYLRNQLPTIAFRASTQQQSQRLGRQMGMAHSESGSKCIGADILMKLFGNYCRNKDIKTSITVGIIGYPNVGKSSVINSLKRRRACNVGALPGITKQVQQIELDQHIRLLDSPGVVLSKQNDLDAVELALKNAIRIESITDPIPPVQAILKRCSRETLMMQYMIAEFDSCEQFLALMARKLGRLKKGARPDLSAAAKHVLNDWNSGKLRYYTEPPVQVESDESNRTFCSSELLNEFSKEFDLDALDNEQKIIVEGLPSSSAMDMGCLYKKEMDETEEAHMETDDTDATTEQRSDCCINVKLKANLLQKSKVEESPIENVLPESLSITGNVQLNRCIKKALKQHKKKSKKIARKADALADSMNMAEIKDDVSGKKQADYSFEDIQM
ncbi:unnamed protein product [Anisakis simplex]|uniref:Guanine nucleotide-binding protein-like 3 homolog n=1 Tax=Anisakis simplex TaxID=6269 RepID=A0A0M3JZN1_ANISI|nr:unnamed protein product [Anisakis simplex]